MNDFDTDLSSGLASLVDLPAPPSSMDVARARQAGRSIRRRRRAAAGSGVATVMVAALLAAVLLPGSGHRGNPPVGGSPTANPSATATARPRLTGTDPFVTTLAFGWLPDGVRTASFEEAKAPDIVQNSPVAETTLNAGGGTTQINLAVLPLYQSFPPVHLKGAVVAPHITAPDVDGHPAYWTFKPGTSAAAQDGEEELYWEYSPERWARLDTSFGDDTSSDLTTTIYRVAENVQYDQTAEVPVPFHLDHAPGGMPVDGQGWTEGSGWTAGYGPGGRSGPGSEPVSPWGAGLSYGYGTPGTAGWTAITISVSVANGQGPPGAATPTTVDGHPATDTLGPEREALAVYGVDGLNVSVYATGAAAIGFINAAGGIQQFFHHITLLGPNSTNWTTAVVG